MTRAMAKLLQIASEQLGSFSSEELRLDTTQQGHAEDLLRTLLVKDGFYAFESALLVLPSVGTRFEPGLGDWNRLDGWRLHYGAIPADTVFFASDALLCQFGIRPCGVVRFDPESGELTDHSSSLEAWAAAVLEDYNFQTAWSICREWQVIHGALPRGYRLLPKVPFVLGGQYDSTNLVAAPMTLAIEHLSRLFLQIGHVPDGTHVSVHGWLSGLEYLG
jgi:hypothetical protein